MEAEAEIYRSGRGCLVDDHGQSDRLVFTKAESWNVLDERKLRRALNASDGAEIIRAFRT